MERLGALSVAARPVRIVLLVVALVVVAALAFVLPSHRVFRLTLVLVNATAVLGLGLATGFNGQVSLGHGAFFALGAYTSAALMVKLDWPYLLTLVPAAAVTFAVGGAVGLLTLRIRGIYLALVTLVLAVATPPLLKRFSNVTGGAMGLSLGVPAAPSWWGIADHEWIYLLALLVLASSMLIVRNLVTSRVGRAVIAIRENELAAQTMGVHLARVKTVTFAWSAMITGIAGVLFAWTFGFISPDSFGFRLSIEFLVMLVIGGLGSIWGPLLGVVALRLVVGAWLAVFTAVFGAVSSGIERAPGIAYAVLVIGTLFVAPRGLAGLLLRGRDRFVHRHS